MKAERELGLVDVLLVTAADGESAAVREVVEGAGSDAWTLADPPCACESDVWTCSFESASGYRMRVALVEALEMGPVPASSLASALVSHCDPRCVAMCGLCAGRPGWTELGDVIIADRVFGYDEGKVTLAAPRFQHDLTTYQLSGAWKKKAKQYRPKHDAVWLGERPLPLARQRNWFLAAFSAGNPRTSIERDQCCPDWHDVVTTLIEEGLIRLDTELPSLTSDGHRAAQNLANSEPNGPPARPPFQVRVGPMATGNKLIEDVGIWQQLSTLERHVLALDMEAAAIGRVGFIGERQLFIAKGVMDHADAKRTNNFRAFAARAAAEVTIGFLREHLEAPSGAVRCMVVHSSDDADLVDEYREHLRKARDRVDLVSHPFCSDSELRPQVAQVDVVLLMIRPGYLRAQATLDLISLARAGECKVLSLICSATDLAGSPMRDFPHIPTSLDPVREATQRGKVWKDVTRRLRALLQP